MRAAFCKCKSTKTQQAAAPPSHPALHASDLADRRARSHGSQLLCLLLVLRHQKSGIW